MLVSVAATSSKFGKLGPVGPEPVRRHAREHALGGERIDHRRGRTRQTDRELVEETVVDDPHPGHTLEALGERDGGGMVERRQAREPDLAQKRQMRGKAQRAQARIGADVARRLLAADVLLACRERQHIAAPSLGIVGLAHEPARHLAHMRVARREEPEMRAAEAHRIAQRLALAGDDVGIHRARRLDQAERYRLGHGDDQKRAGIVARRGERSVIADLAEDAGILDDDA